MLDLNPVSLLIRAVALLIGMTIHEFAHVYVAYRMGDNTGASQGRLTLNPLVHINPIGFLMGVLIGFGFLGSAPVNPYRMRNPRWGYLAAVAAGPFSNLIVAIVFAIPMRIFQQQIFGNDFLFQLFAQIIFLNIILAIFNIIPLFPLDGWSIMYSLLPPEQARWWQANQQNSYYLFMLLILLSFIGGQFNILGILISQPSTQLFRILVGF
ncbi:MAG: site-2 protease family protein [Chloroflexi bacterium]|nr:site-2 protease family protein [Chloroflexota bacterium]MCC6892388.1 site-2 protease family protein [Anaerolineae bacterium]